MVRSGFIIFALGVLAIESSGWYYPPAISKSWNYFRPPVYYYEQPEQTPLELMVDITNALGVAILQDQSFSKANFAFSPYGVASVLVVLYEGSRGESARQIQRAVKFPLDKDLIRVGFRDIHRHLKSYFSHEGYLSGIALNKDILALKPDYKRLLNLYGYDVNFSEKENPESNDNDTSISTEKTSSFSTTAEPFPTATTLLSTTNSSFIEDNRNGSTYGDVQQETTKNVEELTSKAPDTTVYSNEIGENQIDLTGSTEPSTIKQPEVGKEEITTETEKINEIDQQGLDNSINSTETLETKETTTLANIIHDKQPSENEADKENVENSNNNKEVTTNVNESLNGDEITGEKVTATEMKGGITTEGIGAALDNGMLIPQLGDFETTTKSLEKDTAFVAAEELSSTISYTNSEVTEAQTLISTTTETRQNTDIIQTAEQATEQTENNSEMLTSLLNTKTTAETLSSELSTLNEIKSTSTPPSETTKSEFFTTPKKIPPRENLATTVESDFSPLTENEIITSTPSISDKFTTNSEETTEVTSEPSGGTTVASTLISDDKITTARLPISSPNSLDKVQEDKETLLVKLKKKRSISLNSIKMRNQISIVAGSSATRKNIIQQFYDRKNRSFRIKRTVSDYWRSPVDSDLIIQLQNGMYDTYAFRNLEFYKNLPRQLFWVNCNIVTPVPMITHTNIFPYGYIPKLNSKALEFPLDDVRYKLLILLPVERLGLKQLIYDLGNCFLREIIESLRPSKVRIAIPMFMTEGFVILTSSLQKLGIRDVFESDKANLSGMSADSELYVRNIEQSITVVIRNYVEMLDIQTRTMAARHVVQEFEATHPFVYFVLDTATNVALMAGQILDPLNTRIY